MSDREIIGIQPEEFFQIWDEPQIFRGGVWLKTSHFGSKMLQKSRRFLMVFGCFGKDFPPLGLVPWYQDIIPKKQLRVLIYHGDTDPGSVKSLGFGLQLFKGRAFQVIFSEVELQNSLNVPYLHPFVSLRDVTCCCPGLNSFFGENWTSSLGFQELQSWRPWTRDGKMTLGTQRNVSFGGMFAKNHPKSSKITEDLGKRW